jgi:hypothetical protein
MWIDVARLYDFYQTPQGDVVRSAINHQLKSLWHDSWGQTIACFGYGHPFMDHFLGRCTRALMMMPAPMGVCPFPLEGPNLACLCPVDRIPLPDCSVNKLLIIHSLEFAADPKTILREAWRVLVSGGELLIFVPNRRGLWARAPLTPFGVGTPYSGRQLYTLADEACFTPIKPTYCLYHPPVDPFLSHTFQEGLENFGHNWLKKIGGLVMMQAHKRVAANIKQASPPIGKRIFIPEGLMPQKRSLGRQEVCPPKKGF